MKISISNELVFSFLKQLGFFDRKPESFHLWRKNGRVFICGEKNLKKKNRKCFFPVVFWFCGTEKASTNAGFFFLSLVLSGQCTFWVTGRVWKYRRSRWIRGFLHWIFRNRLFWSHCAETRGLSLAMMARTGREQRQGQRRSRELWQDHRAGQALPDARRPLPWQGRGVGLWLQQGGGSGGRRGDERGELQVGAGNAGRIGVGEKGLRLDSDGSLRRGEASANVAVGAEKNGGRVGAAWRGRRAGPDFGVLGRAGWTEGWGGRFARFESENGRFDGWRKNGFWGGD